MSGNQWVKVAKTLILIVMLIALACDAAFFVGLTLHILSAINKCL